jgi:hypothetical protein
MQTDLHCAPSPTRCAEENVNHVDPTMAIKANARILIDPEVQWDPSGLQEL